jgi:hypothetical protein
MPLAGAANVVVGRGGAAVVGAGAAAAVVADAVAAAGALGCGWGAWGAGTDPPWGTLSCCPGTISEFSLRPFAAKRSGSRTLSLREMPNSVSPCTIVYRSPIVGTGEVGIVGCVGGAVCWGNVGAAVGGGGLVDGARVVGAVLGTNTVVVGAVDVVLLAVTIGTSGGLS